MGGKTADLGRVLVIESVLDPDEILKQQRAAVIYILVQHLVAVPETHHSIHTLPAACCKGEFG